MQFNPRPWGQPHDHFWDVSCLKIRWAFFHFQESTKWCLGDNNPRLAKMRHKVSCSLFFHLALIKTGSCTNSYISDIFFPVFKYSAFKALRVFFFWRWNAFHWCVILRVYAKRILMTLWESPWSWPWRKTVLTSSETSILIPLKLKKMISF